MTIVTISKDYLITQDQDSITLTLPDNYFKEEPKLLPQPPVNQENQNQESTTEDNPWIKLAGKYENDPMYDEVLSYIEDYRHQLDAEIDQVL